MAGESTTVAVSELINSGELYINDGYRAKNSELATTGIPFARVANVNQGFHLDNTDCFPLSGIHRVGMKISQPGDVVFTSKGTVGRFAFVKEDTPRFVYSPQLCFWRSLNEERIHSKWLYYWMQGREFLVQYASVASQTDMAEYVSLRDQRQMRVTLPSLPEQHAIAHTLGTLDDKVELNRRMNETLEAMARALFKSWFVDFDPVRAKAEGRDAGLPKHIADLFPDRFQDSELAEIPEGWSVGSLLEQAQLLSGGTPKTDRPEYWDGRIQWVSAKDVSQSNQSLLISTERTITELGLHESATQIIPAFATVVVARGATTGRMAMLGSDMAMNQTCYALHSSFGCNFSLYCQVQQVMDELVHRAHGSIFNTITTNTFQTSRFVLPTVNILREFESRMEPMFRPILARLKKSRTLRAIRDTLLPKLLSGEIRVKDAEYVVEEVV